MKADGLAAGKGVTVADSPEQARAALREIFVEGRFTTGDPAHPNDTSAVVEERLSGREISLLALCDGEWALTLEPARDYKRLLDGEEGPNTGGMGAYSPVPGLEYEDDWRIAELVHLPILGAMQRRGTPFRGVLYAGLMLTEQGPKVLELNVRFGDPETQALLPRLNADLLGLMLRTLRPGGRCWEKPRSRWWNGRRGGRSRSRWRARATRDPPPAAIRSRGWSSSRRTWR